MMRFIGRISYSLYLWLQPFLILDSAAPQNGLGWWQHWPVALVGPFVFALASHYVVERPMIRLGGKLHGRTRARAAEAIAASS